MALRLGVSPFAATTAAVLALSPMTAVAARPIGGGRYEAKPIALTVSDDSHGLSPQGLPPRSDAGASLASEVRFPRCGDVPANTVVLADVEGADPMQITPSGRFSLDEAKPDANRPDASRHLTLKGQFTSSTLARAVLRLQTVTPTNTCNTARIRVTLKYTGERHKLFGTCTPPYTGTLARSGDVGLYWARFRAQADLWNLRAEHVVYLCGGSFGRRDIIEVYDYSGDEEGYGAISTLGWVISGPYYAFEEDFCCENGFVRVNVAQLADAKKVTSLDCRGQFTPEAFNPCEHAWYLGESGSLAWSDTISSKPQTTRVVIQSVAGKPQVVDTDVVVKSLELAGTTLSWTRSDGELRSMAFS